MPIQKQTNTKKVNIEQPIDNDQNIIQTRLRQVAIRYQEISMQTEAHEQDILLENISVQSNQGMIALLRKRYKLSELQKKIKNRYSISK